MNDFLYVNLRIFILNILDWLVGVLWLFNLEMIVAIISSSIGG